ncbi:MAG: toprim domain-containing protein [Rhodospirillales bacterium]|nr:toprim domain-containing protein [Rhodospirillales bacterium]
MAGGFVMPRDASELSRRLARDAEAACRHYLSNGRRQGRYWTVGDVRNAPGRSMFVRLSGPESGPGAAGHWTDAASAEHGDLLDVIRESCGLIDFRDVAEEARRFLSLPRPEPRQAPTPVRTPVPAGSPEAARRLIAMSQPIGRTLVETYLSTRGIEAVHDAGALRYQPRCYYRPDDGSLAQRRPAMIAAVTDLDGKITGAHRTWLAPDGFGKAAVDTPRRAMGSLLGHAVRFGAVDDVLAVGEGIETMLSLRLTLPAMPMAVALSANHLSALLLPPTLRRLYIARDADAAGDMALAALTERAAAAGIEALALSPRLGDFNEDLQAFGPGALRAALRPQLAPQDAVRFIREASARTG